MTVHRSEKPQWTRLRFIATRSIAWSAGTIEPSACRAWCDGCSGQVTKRGRNPQAWRGNSARKLVRAGPIPVRWWSSARQAAAPRPGHPRLGGLRRARSRRCPRWSARWRRIFQQRSSSLSMLTGRIQEILARTSNRPLRTVRDQERLQMGCCTSFGEQLAVSGKAGRA
jgi:hypothetical protein